MDPRTLVMTSGPEELPFQQNELFEGDFSNNIAQVNFELNSKSSLGDLSSAYDGAKCSWEQPWQDDEAKILNHLPIKEPCDSLDEYSNELSNSGHIFSMSSEILVQERELLTSSSMDFNSREFINSDEDQTPEAAVQKDTDFNSFGATEQMNSFLHKSLCDSNAKAFIPTANTQTESYAGESCGKPEVAPEGLDCEEGLKTNQEKIDSMINEDFCEAVEELQQFGDDQIATDDRMSAKNEADRIPASDEADRILASDEADPMSTNDEADQMSTNDEADRRSTNDEADRRSTNDEADRTSTNDEADRRSTNDEADRRSTNDEADRRSTNDEADRTSTNDEADRRSTNDEADRTSTNDEADRRSTNDEADRRSTNDEADRRSTNDEADRRSTNDEAERLATDIEVDQFTEEDEMDQMATYDEKYQMEQGLFPHQIAENDVSKPVSPTHQVDVEMSSASSGITGTLETITEPTEADDTHTAPLSDSNDQCLLASISVNLNEMYRFHPVVLIREKEPLSPISYLFECVSCQYTAKSADLLIDHHCTCHPVSRRGIVVYEEAKKMICNLPDPSPPLKPGDLNQGKFKGPYVCEKCQLKFTKIHVYVKHMRKHTGKTPYFCDRCGHYFAQAGILRRHRLTALRCNPLKSRKNAKKETKGVIVGVSKKSQRDIKYDENISECYIKLTKITKIHECNSCRKTFLSLVKAKKHFFNVHRRKTGDSLLSHIITKRISAQTTAAKETVTMSENTFKCPLCPRLFKYGFNRSRHLRKCVSEKISNGGVKRGGKYLCPLCPTSFTMTSNRYRHIKNFCLRKSLKRLSEVESLKPSKQEKDSKGKLESEMEKAKNAHQYKSQPNAFLRCRFCETELRTLSSLRRHELIHHNDKPYICKKCGRRFKEHSDLIEHKDVHQGRIHCHACLKILPTIGELIQHCKFHRQTGNLRCPDCLQQFKDLTIYIGHLESLRIQDAKTKGLEDELQLSGDKGPPSKKAKLEMTNNTELALTVKKEPHKCEICQAEFPKKHMLAGHHIGHKLNTLIECQKCRRFFGRKRIQFHRMTCKNIRPESKDDPSDAVNESAVKRRTFTCSVCHRTFTKEIYLNRHLHGHKAKTLLLCNTCGQYFGCRKLRPHQKICKKVPQEIITPSPVADCSPPMADGLPPMADGLPPMADSSPTMADTSPQMADGSPQMDDGSPQMDDGSPPVADDAPPTTNGSDLKSGYCVCPICGRELGKKGRLRSHLLDHKNKSLVPCPGCGHHFWDTKLHMHQRNCKKSCNPDVILSVVPNIQKSAQETTSLAAVTKRLPFKCQHCPLEFKYRSKLMTHTVKHTGLQPYLCAHCGKRFPSRLSLIQHKKTCNKVEGDCPRIDDVENGPSNISPLDEKPTSMGPPDKAQTNYKCTFCNKSFLKQKKLRQHILTHNEAKPYRCKSCRSSFSRFDHLKVHQANCKLKKMRLEVCLPKISLEDVGHGWKRTPFYDCVESVKENLECKFCFKTFPAMSTLNRHFTLFHAVKRFKCTTCGSAFSHEKSLKYHIKKKECVKVLKKLTTSLLSTSWTTRETNEDDNPKILKTHLKKKSDYSCPYCPLSFKKGYALKYHMRFHNGVKPFACEYCDERFPRRDYVKRHHVKCKVLLNESEERPARSQPKMGNNQTKEDTLREKLAEGFSCAYCSARFSLFSQLQEHFLNVHQLETADQPMTTASLQHHLSNMSNVNKEGSLDGSNLTCELDTILSDEASKKFQCTKCPKSFSKSSTLLAHLRAHVPYFHCVICRKGFWNKMSLQKHKRKCKRENVPATDNLEYSVEDISTKTTNRVVISTKSSVETSVKSQRKEVRYQCSECPKSFTDGLLLITHLEDHGREEMLKKKHTCFKCGKNCGSPANLTKHMRIHYNDKKNSCPDCSKVFNSQSELDNHRILHDPSRPYACKLCTYRYNSGPTLCAHYSQEHPDDMFTCSFCEKTFSVETSLKRHYLKHHKQEVENNAPQLASGKDSYSDDEDDSDSDTAPYFPCHVCGKTFTTSESLEDHQRCHLGEKPHECGECGRCFFQAGQLEQHQRMHKSEYQCQLCGKGFVTHFALRKHRFTHGKSRPHRCSKCQLTFTGAAQLAEHMASHREENFPCDICNLVFHSKSSRVEHRKTHASEGGPTSSGQKGSDSVALHLKYRCAICQERFGEPEALSEHGCMPAPERRYSCKTCDKHFLHASHLIKHQSTQHSGIEYSTDSLTLDLKKELELQTDFVCSVCNRCFPNSDELKEHLSTHAEMVTFIKAEEPCTSETKMNCPGCNGSFSGSKAYDEHVCSKRPRPFMPSVNNNEMASPADREDEEVDVIGDDLYDCTDCTVKFTSQSDLLKHRKILHVNAKPHQCKLCGKAFAARPYLQKHMKRHRAKQDGKVPDIPRETDFRCYQCDDFLASKEELLVHLDLHKTGVGGPYSCDMCHLLFKHWSLFKQHQESHMGQVVYECNECDQVFAFPNLLVEHQRIHASQR